MRENTLADAFLEAAMSLLRKVREEEAERIGEAGRLVAQTIQDGGRIFVCGAGHSSLPAQDVVYRAGGLGVVNLLAIPGTVGVDVMPATLGSALERVGGLAQAVLDSSPARSGDLLFILSLSGRNVLPVELATHAHSLGMKVVGVTSVAYAAAGSTGSRHPSGTYLKDHCDLVLDSKVPVGDAELTAPNVAAPFAPASTVVTSALMQSVMATATGVLADSGVEPPLLRSGNVDGGGEWNARVFTEYRDRIFHQH